VLLQRKCACGEHIKGGGDFAGHYLRTGAHVVTTTKSLRPKCSAPLFTHGACTAFDGPFYSRAAFHAGKYWRTIKGRL